MKNILLILSFALSATILMAQEVKIYNPEADAKEAIKAAVKEAAKSGKHVFLQIGGNWCPWCIKFHRFVEEDAEIADFVQKNYVVVKVNYDPKNKNKEVLAGLEYPQRFGFPVFVVLDGKGNRIHTQNSAFLEKDKGYDHDKVLRFYKNWSPAALDPKNYE